MSPLLTLPRAALIHTVASIREAGSGEREAAVFWLGRSGGIGVDQVVVPTGPDVELFPLSLRIGEQSMLRLAKHCDATSRVVLGAAHSHPDAAFFSLIDADAFFHAVDCVSVVLPSYGATTAENAAVDWPVFVGLPQNRWRVGSWASDIELLDSGSCERVSLE